MSTNDFHLADMAANQKAEIDADWQQFLSASEAHSQAITERNRKYAHTVKAAPQRIVARVYRLSGRWGWSVRDTTIDQKIKDHAQGICYWRMHNNFREFRNPGEITDWEI